MLRQLASWYLGSMEINRGPLARRCGHDPAQVVAGQPLFASLTADECEALVERSVCRSVRRGEVLFREGAPCRGLYLVVEGAVCTYRANREGQEQVFGVFGAGESLGGVSMFDEGPYLASARVAEDGRVLFLPMAEVQALYRTHPEVAQAVVRELATRLRSLAALVDRLALQDVPTRVASAVLAQAEASGALRPGGSYRMPRTQQQLAAELGTTREGVARALRRLRTAGAISQRGAVIEIRDARLLRQLAGRNVEGANTSSDSAPGPHRSCAAHSPANAVHRSRGDSSAHRAP